MGCGSSLPLKTVNIDNTIITPTIMNNYHYPQQTRIIQEEEVDICIEDEYNKVENDWTHWSENMQTVDVNGEWQENLSAGGSRNDLEMFSINPQFLLILGPVEKHLPKDQFLFLDHRRSGSDISVCLTQINTATPKHIAFFIYKTDKKEDKLNAEYFLCMQPEGDTGAFVNWRQLRHDFRLYPGQYVIVPAIFKLGIPGKFKLSVSTPDTITFKQIFP